MNQDEVLEAIRGPLAQVDARTSFEPELQSRLVNDLTTGGLSLFLLQLYCRSSIKLWWFTSHPTQGLRKASRR